MSGSLAVELSTHSRGWDSRLFAGYPLVPPVNTCHRAVERTVQRRRHRVRKCPCGGRTTRSLLRHLVDHTNGTSPEGAGVGMLQSCNEVVARERRLFFASQRAVTK